MLWIVFQQQYSGHGHEENILMSRFSELFSMYPNNRRPVEFSFSSGMLLVAQVTVCVEPRGQIVRGVGQRMVGLQASSSTGWMGAAVANANKKAEKIENIVTVLNILNSSREKRVICAGRAVDLNLRLVLNVSMEEMGG
jgi:hypothetical protein